jgi:hypothetical protein
MSYKREDSGYYIFFSAEDNYYYITTEKGVANFGFIADESEMLEGTYTGFNDPTGSALVELIEE